MTDSGPAPQAKPPFFILGCVRSGTTMLRDVIASHPMLFCPNETHYFRIADPFGTINYMLPFLNQKIFKSHRALDGIGEEDFKENLMLPSNNRRELMERYAQAYMRAQKAPEGARWFDKTPQHVYGAILLADQFPDSKFIHIVRHPLNVISSLRTSKVMNIQSIVGASNYWLESAIIMKHFRKLVGDRLLEIRYAEFTDTPKEHLDRIFAFIDEDPAPMTFNLKKIKPETARWEKVLPAHDIDKARAICGDLATEYGFEF